MGWATCGLAAVRTLSLHELCVCLCAYSICKRVLVCLCSNINPDGSVSSCSDDSLWTSLTL